jgi:carbonic anhydrase
MYNMDISIFGYKLNLEVLILIGVVYLILVGHTVCGSCNYGLMEAFETASETAINTANKVNNILGSAVSEKVKEKK